MFRPEVNEELCNGCGNCVVACPRVASELERVGHGFGSSASKARVESGLAKFEFECSGCGICLEVCGRDAIRLVRALS